MEALNSILDQDTLYWILGGGVPALAILVYLIVNRVGRGSRPAETSLPPLQSVPPPFPGSLDQQDHLAESLTVVRTPANETVPAADARDIGAAESDLPPDLAVRARGGLAEDASVKPHTPQEIQKPAPKPLFTALSNTRNSLFGRIKSVFSKPTLTADELEGLEEILYTSDLGPQTVQRLMDAVETRLKADGGAKGFEAVREALKDEMLHIFGHVEKPQLHLVKGDEEALGPAVHKGAEEYLEGLERLSVWDHKPAVLLVVGVNGAGKTTTIGKLARRFAQSGRRVLVAAGDTFRAAASDQLKIWTDRAQVEILSPENVIDPSAVAYMAVEKAQADAFDIVIIDTAGRLHTQKNLMEELRKMKRVIQKKIETAPHEVLLVLDANSGQNALVQAREFHQALEVTGVVLTKLDGTAKGGVAVGLACELQIPIKLIGVGEGIDDLRRFSSREFVDSIL